MNGIRRTSDTRAFATLLLVALASCQSAPPAAPVRGSEAAPAPSASQTHLVLKLYSGSSTGLVVSQAPAGGNPASQLPGQSFADNPGLDKTFIWSFAPEAAVLDASCHAITRTQAINIANSPGANSIAFISSASSAGQAPTLKVQILAAHADAASC